MRETVTSNAMVPKSSAMSTLAARRSRNARIATTANVTHKKAWLAGARTTANSRAMSFN